MQPARFSGTDTVLDEMVLRAHFGPRQPMLASQQRLTPFIAPDYSCWVVTGDLWIDWLLRWTGELELARRAFEETSNRRKRQRSAAAMLRRWMSEADSDDEATWQHLERELPALRLRLRTTEDTK